MTTSPLFESRLSLPLLGRGKVRDIYAVDDERLLIVSSDRLSAFDVVMPDPIPEKGRVLTQLSNFWFRTLADVVPNHLTEYAVSDVLAGRDLDAVRERAVVVRRLQPLPVEAVVRGYLIGSGWRDYLEHGSVCGHRLPAGLAMAAALDEPIFTPATKAARGEHDENIDFASMAALIGEDHAAQVRRLALELYTRAAAFALERGIIIADTKFEFGVDADGGIVLIDEALTPDSSRFWPAETYEPGLSPPSFDKQYVRDYLESTGWNKAPPAPALPAEVIARTSAKYLEALRRLTATS